MCLAPVILSDEYQQLLASGCTQLGLTLDQGAQQKLLKYIALLRRWNKSLNLTAITSTREMIIQHLLDSLAVGQWVKGDRVLDIGSGGGFPGIPLALMFPDKTITLLDSRGKRVEFLRHASASLGLTNVLLVKSRVEDYRPVEKFDTLVNRAFSSLSDMLDWTDALQQSDTRLLAMKGKSPDSEIEQLDRNWQQLARVEAVDVPFLEAERHVVLIDF